MSYGFKTAEDRERENRIAREVMVGSISEKSTPAPTINQPRDYQIFAKESLEWEAIDLLQDEDNQGHKVLSRADLILVFALYNNSGLVGFLTAYKEYANDFINRYGANAIILKPHHYLKQLIG